MLARALIFLQIFSTIFILLCRKWRCTIIFLFPPHALLSQPLINDRQVIWDDLIFPVRGHAVSFYLLLLIMSILNIHPCVILEVSYAKHFDFFANQVLLPISVHGLIRAIIRRLLLQLLHPCTLSFNQWLWASHDLLRMILC